jgi:hypothetical protein
MGGAVRVRAGVGRAHLRKALRSPTPRATTRRPGCTVLTVLTVLTVPAVPIVPSTHSTLPAVPTLPERRAEHKLEPRAERRAEHRRGDRLEQRREPLVPLGQRGQRRVIAQRLRASPRSACVRL